MFQKFKVLVVVATLATVGRCQPLDTQLQGQLQGRHFFGRFARDVSDDDTVGQITGLLEDGGKIPKRAISKMKSQLTNFDKLLTDANGNIAKIQRELGKIGEIDITRDYLDGYWQAKKEVRLAQIDLRELAKRTTAAVQDIKILIEDWDNKEASFIEKEFQILKRLVEECLRVLKDVKVKYTNAINSMEKTSDQLSETTTSLSLMLDEKSTEYSAWTEKVRAGVYGAAGAVTAGMIVLDIFGCFGLCSAIVTTSTWTGSIAGVEASIADYTDELAQLETAVNGVLSQIKDVEGTVDDYIKFLEEELARTDLRDWEVAADNVKAKLALFSVEELQRVAAYQKIFVKNLDELNASAQAFLDQGAEIYSDDEPAQN